jgi:hypothetical protein
MAKYRSWVEGLKFVDFPTALRKLAMEHNLDCDVVVEKGILRETTFFTVEGDLESIESFKKSLSIGIENYNNPYHWAED